jgi:tetratricopeptide (TPR) repeat protein
LAVAMMHIHNPLRPPRQLKQDIPEAIERVILRSMAKDPADRFQTAEEMAEALRAASIVGPGVAVPATHAPAPAAQFTPPSAASPSGAGVEIPPAADPLPGAPAALDVPAPQRAGPRRLWFAAVGLAALLAVVALVLFLTRGQAGSGSAAAPTGNGTAASPAGAVATSVLPDDIRQALDTTMRQLDVSDGGVALETLKPALAAHPDNPDLLAARGIADAMYSGNDVAKADIDRALSLDANNPLAYYARGYLNQKTDRPDEAIADFTRAIELDPTFARAYYQRSRVLNYAKNDYAGERRDLDRAIELAPDLIAPRMSRAYALYYASDLEEALPDLDHVLSLDPKHSEALYLRALLYAGLDRPADARRDFDAAAAAAPDDVDVFRERAAFLVRQRDYAAALADADKLVALDSAEPRWQVLRGFTLHALDRDDDALKAFDQALLIGGNELWAARYGRGLALLTQGRAQDALGDLEAAQAHANDTAEASELFYGTSAMPSVDLARAYQALGQSEKALQALDVALKQDESFIAFLERGRARAAAGNRDGARTDLQEALRRAIEAKDDKQRTLVEAELKKIQ